MALSEPIPIEQIEAIVKAILQDHLKTAIEEFVRQNEQKAQELSLIERIIRVEEELKALKEIELARFEAIEKRFEAVDKRFEAIDKRYEALQREMNARFEALQREMNARFESLIREMNARFEAIEKRLNFMQWFMGIGFTILSLLMSLLIVLLKFF